MYIFFRLYSSSDPPPVELVRIPQFLQLLVDALFKPGAKLNQVNLPAKFYQTRMHLCLKEACEL